MKRTIIALMGVMVLLSYSFSLTMMFSESAFADDGYGEHAVYNHNPDSNRMHDYFTGEATN